VQSKFNMMQTKVVGTPFTITTTMPNADGICRTTIHPLPVDPRRGCRYWPVGYASTGHWAVEKHLLAGGVTVEYEHECIEGAELKGNNTWATAAVLYAQAMRDEAETSARCIDLMNAWIAE